MSLDKKEPAQGLDAFMAEEGLGGDETLRDLLTPLANLATIPAPAPGKELAALMAQKHTPSSWQRWLHKHRPTLVGIAVLAGMGAGVTGVAASNPDTASSIYRSIVGENAPGWASWWEQPEAAIAEEDPETTGTQDSGVSTGSTSGSSADPTPERSTESNSVPAGPPSETPLLERVKVRPPAGQRPDTVPGALAGQRNHAPDHAAGPQAGAAHAAPGRALPAGQVPPTAGAGNVLDPYIGQSRIPSRVQFQLLGLGPVLVTTVPQLPYDLRDLAFLFEPSAVEAASSVDQLKDQLAAAGQDALPAAADTPALEASGPSQSGPLRPGLGGVALKESGLEAAQLELARLAPARDGANHRANQDGDDQAKEGKSEAAPGQAGVTGKSFLPAGLVGAKPWSGPAPVAPEQNHAGKPAWTPRGLADPSDVRTDAPASDGPAGDGGTTEPPNEDTGVTGNGGENAPANEGRAARLLEPVVEAVQPSAGRSANGNRPGIVRDAGDFLKNALGSKR